jgi:hypothetical protein
VLLVPTFLCVVLSVLSEAITFIFFAYHIIVIECVIYACPPCNQNRLLRMALAANSPCLSFIETLKPKLVISIQRWGITKTITALSSINATILEPTVPIVGSAYAIRFYSNRVSKTLKHNTKPNKTKGWQPDVNTFVRMCPEYIEQRSPFLNKGSSLIARLGGTQLENQGGTNYLNASNLGVSHISWRKLIGQESNSHLARLCKLK